MSAPAWRDGFSARHVADPFQAAVDVREAHGWATRTLAKVPRGSIREFNLDQERKRLAGIAWELKRLYGV